MLLNLPCIAVCCLVLMQSWSLRAASGLAIMSVSLVIKTLLTSSFVSKIHFLLDTPILRG